MNERYHLLEQVGEGGMATVYRALDTRLGRIVAIKVLHSEYARDQPFVQRFQQEAEFAASLGGHPNIVAIYDIGHDEGRHYIVMELVEGQSLKDVIRTRAPLTVDEAFALGRQVALALDFAHKRGLVHRDIKPQNIMVTPDGAAKVTDFGIAQSVTASQLTRTGMVIGTVHYFSPEQAQGRTASPASDIYSLGIILYEMLTAHLPFDAENAVGVAMKHLHSDPPSMWTYNPRLQESAVSTVLRALEKDPQQRYRDAAEFAAALAAPVSGTVRGTTVLSPVVAESPPQPTSVYATTEPVVPRQRVVREPVAQRQVRRAPVAVPSNPWRTSWLALGGLLAVLLIAGVSFFVFNRAFGGAAAATPTATATAQPSPTATPHRKRKTPVPTVPIFVTAVPTLAPIVPTSTPQPVVPTNTPKPIVPTATSAPPPPLPTPTVEVQILGPTETPTAVG